MAISATRPRNPIIMEFSQHNFAGLDTDVIDPIRKPLEHSKSIKRFLNDEYVKARDRHPSLYDHILGGLDLAKKEIFDKLDGVKKLAEDFNKAYLVHDFGEMMMEFSTFYGRFNKKENEKFNRAKTEKNVAELVFRSLKTLGGKFFIKIFTEASDKIKKVKSYDGKLKEAQELVDAGKSMFTTFKKKFERSFKDIQKFTDEWMGYFDMSQNPKNQKTSFIANLVKVIDKLEGQITATNIHNKQVSNKFARAMILNYLKAFKGLVDSKEAKAANKGSANKKVLDQVDKMIRLQFMKDNAELGKRSNFKSFEEAYTLTPSLAA